MSKFVGLTCAFLMGGAALCAQSTLPAVVETTGVVGLAEAQTARLNLLNPGALPPASDHLHRERRVRERCWDRGQIGHGDGRSRQERWSQPG